MTVDHSLFQARFSSFPGWECPTCAKGHMEVMKETLKIEETGPSKRAHSHEAFEPDWVEKRFVCLLKCNFGLCGELSAAGGRVILGTEIEEDPSGHSHEFWVDQYEPEFILPAPMPIRLSDQTPVSVEASLRDAASLIWKSAEAAANHVRQAVENLMDALNVPTHAPGGGKLKLHHRIEEFQKTDPDNGEILLAIKWLGNSGSHAGGVTRENVLDAFDMVELVVTKLFDTTAQQILAKVKAVNAAKGPRRSRLANLDALRSYEACAVGVERGHIDRAIVEKHLPAITAFELVALRKEHLAHANRLPVLRRAELADTF